MNPDTAAAVNEHLGEAFDHLREAIMLAIAGEPSGAMGRLERFAATGDVAILTEGMEDLSLVPRPGETSEDVLSRVTDAALQAEAEGLFDNEEFSKKVEPMFNPDQDNQGPSIDTSPIDDPSVDTDDDLLELDIPDDEEDEFSGLFDDIDEEEADDGPSDAPAAF